MKEIKDGLGAIVASSCLTAAACLLWVTIHVLKGMAFVVVGVTAVGFLMGASPDWLAPWLILTIVALFIVGGLLPEDLPGRLMNEAINVARRANSRLGEKG